MKNALKLFEAMYSIAIIAFLAIIGFSMAACGGGDNGGTTSGGNVPPEDKPAKDRWGKYVAEDSTATLVYSVDANGVCIITVGGTPEPQNETDGWNIWKANVQYDYTAKANTRYAYTFEAWTQSGARHLYVQYYYDNVENSGFGEDINITGTRTTYTIYGEEIPKGGLQRVEFQCADQTGTFYVKMLEIKEFENNWDVWRDDSSTATLNYSIAHDEVCTVTVGGTPEKYEEGAWNAWKISAEYAYTGNAGKLYDYTFEAWTQSGTRNLHVKYYYDGDTNVSIVDHSITITTTRKSYTVYGKALPKSGKRYVSFELADQLGTVNIKMLEIKEYNWNVQNYSSTATVNYSIADDRVCTITVGGTPESNNETDGYNIWKIRATINYTAKANTKYTYTFEAWTASSTRDLYVQYYYDNVENSNLGKNINITGTRTTYTISGGEIPKGGLQQIEFQCANQTGTFYVKMLEIKGD